MPDSPLISVVVPVYNQVKYIRQALESIASQTYTNLQIVIGDDCSKDGTIEILRTFEENDSRIKLMISETNLGICANFNRLFDAVEGEYVVFFSGDDIMMPDKIAKQFEVFKKYSKVVLVHHDAWMIDENSSKRSIKNKGQLVPVNPLDWALRVDWFNCKRITSVMPTSCMAKTDYYLRSRYDNRLQYKHELLFTIEDYCANPSAKWYYIDEPLICYRDHADNFSNNPIFVNRRNEEKLKLAELADEKCPKLKKRINHYRLFTLYETIVFEQYNETFEEKKIVAYFKDNAGFFFNLVLSASIFFKKQGLYWAISKLLHHVFFRPYYKLRSLMQNYAY